MQSSNALVTPEINLTHIAKRAFQENGGIDVILADNGDNFRKTIFQSSDFTTDEKFEILEQLTCVINHSRNSPHTVQASPNLIIFPVQATVVSAISPFQNDISGCKPPKVIEKRSSLLLQINKSPSNFRQRIKLTLRGDFKHIFNLISPKGQSKLVRGNCHSPNVMRTLTYKDFMRFELDKNDLRVALSLSLQEKQKAKGSESAGEGSNEDAMVSLPRTIITALPIRSKVTQKALTKFGLGQPIDLYLKAKPEELVKIFRRFPSIPKHDQQNIFAGISLVQYLRKMK